MPQVFIMIRPRVQNREELQGEKLEALGQALMADVERTWPETREDVALSVVSLVYAFKEADVQVEVRYTAGEDEYGTGKIFDPSKEEKERLVAAMTKTLTDALSGCADSVSVWPIPIRDSVFSFVPL